MMTSPSVAASMPPMKEKFHKIIEIPSKVATNFAKRFGFYDYGGCDFRLPREDDTEEGPAKDGGLPFHTIDFSQGGVRVPLDHLLCRFLKQVGLLPTQLAPSFFEIFNGFRCLGSKILDGVWLNLDDLSYYYRLAKKGNSYTLESRYPGKYLVTHIPESHHGLKPYVVYLTGSFETDVKCPRVAGHPDCRRVFPQCKSPPHKKLLDRLLDDSTVDRSVAHLLGYKQLNSRLRQIGSYSPAIRKKATVVVDSTESEESESNSTSGSEYNPFTEMSQVGDEAVQSELERNKSKCHAMIGARKAKMSKTGLGGQGKVAAGSSSAASPCVTGDETILVPPPRAPAGRGKTGRTPSYYDVDRCPQWVGPSVGEGVTTGMQSSPVLPRPCRSHGFGVIGATPQYAHDVIGPYMSFSGDEEKLKTEDMDDGFGAMMENSTAQLARLSFYSRAVKESKREADMRYNEIQAEVSRMRVALDEAVARQGRLVQDAVAAYNKGAKEGGVEGWEEALKAYRDADYLDPAVVGNVPCYLGVSDEEEDLMEGDGVGGGGVGCCRRL